MASAKVRFSNPALLAWARESAGYTVSDIAALLGKPERVVADWEVGADSPTYRQLEVIARKVKRPLAAFFLPTVPEEPSPPPDFRTLPGVEEGSYGPKALVAFRQARGALSEARALLDELGVEIGFSLPPSTLDGDPEEEAKGVRLLLRVTVETQRGCEDRYQALDMWREALFDRGVVVMVFSMPMEDARAFCLMDHTLAAVGLNSADGGRAFSLFHEVGHLCLRRPGVSGEVALYPSRPRREKDRIERYCDRFAAEFLLPARDPQVQAAMESVGGDTSRIDEVARDFKVSRYVVLRRALELGHLEKDRYWQIYTEWQESAGREGERKAGGGDYVTTTVSHLGKRFVALVFDALDANVISTYDASKLLYLDPRHFRTARARASAGTGHGR